MGIQTIKALIFDFDGLILETEGPIHQSWQELYAGFGLDLPMDLWSTTIGTMDPEWDPLEALETALSRKIEPEILARRQQRETELILRQPVMPGVAAALASARRLGLKLGVASSSGRSWVAGHLTRLGLMRYFSCVKTLEDVQFTKPDPGLYLAALECLGVTAGQAVAFEDSPNGLLAARRAGLFCVAVPNPITVQLSLEAAHLQIRSLDEMPLEALLKLVDRRRNGSVPS